MALLPWVCRKSNGQRSDHHAAGLIAKSVERGRVVEDAAAVLTRVV
jgi:hypothetical protein